MVKNNAAVLGMSGLIMVPLSYLSSRFLRSHHPVIVGTAEQDSLDPSLRIGLYMGILAFVLLYSFLLNIRMQIEEMDKAIFSRKMGNL